MTGRATVAHCDVLIAVWDGLPPRGRGGTGEVVQLALTRGTRDHPRSARSPARDTRLLWSAFDPTVVTVADDPTAARPLDARRRRPAAARPADAAARPAGAAFPQALPAASGCGGSVRGSNIRCCSTAAGVGRFRRARPHEQTLRGANPRRMAPVPRRLRRCAQHLRGDRPAGKAYSWADRLATHFAQTYRSGHVFNFVLGGFAVCLGLSASWRRMPTSSWRRSNA